jgi:hypothetical protein
MTPGPTARDETACNSDDSTTDGIEGKHAGQDERQDDGGCATLPVALGVSEHDHRDAEEKCGGEERSAGLREPEPTAEPSPIASQQRHARTLDLPNERHSSAGSTSDFRAQSLPTNPPARREPYGSTRCCMSRA